MKNESTDIVESIITVTAAAIFGLILITIGGLYGILAAGFVGMKLWAWFIVPVFAVKPLTIIQAWGIALLVGLWTKQQFTNTNKDERSTAEKVAWGIGVLIWPWLILLMGWLGKTFLM